jgi:hypothetical protein
MPLLLRRCKWIEDASPGPKKGTKEIYPETSLVPQFLFG